MLRSERVISFLRVYTQRMYYMLHMYMYIYVTYNNKQKLACKVINLPCHHHITHIISMLINVHTSSLVGCEGGNECVLISSMGGGISTVRSSSTSFSWRLVSPWLTWAGEASTFVVDSGVSTCSWKDKISK